MAFLEELQHLINKHCRENESDTPDFILAEYLAECLSVYAKCILKRDKWYGFKGLSRRMTGVIAERTVKKKPRGGRNGVP